MPEPDQRPFIIEHRRAEEPGGKHTPTARLVVSPSLRESGLLSLLSGRQARLLLALITYLSANGQVQATAHQIGVALGLPTRLAALWLSALCARRFHGFHLIYRVRRDEGHAVYCLSRAFLTREHQPPPQTPHIVIQAAGRERMYAHSREHYARPRAEVEREVMEQLGHSVEELLDTPEGEVWRGLHDLRFEPEAIRSLIRAYGVEAILQQLNWLPKRRAKNPGRFLVVALRERFGAPKPFLEPLDGPTSETPPTQASDPTANPFPDA